MTSRAAGDYREFLMPGIFALTMVFGIEATFIAVTDRRGQGRHRPVPLDADVARPRSCSGAAAPT